MDTNIEAQGRGPHVLHLTPLAYLTTLAGLRTGQSPSRSRRYPFRKHLRIYLKHLLAGPRPEEQGQGPLLRRAANPGALRESSARLMSTSAA